MYHVSRKTLHSVAVVFLCVLAAMTSTALAKQDPVQHARSVIKFFDNHPKQSRTASGAKAVLRAAHVLDSTVRSLQEAKALKAATALPPHDALWQCLHVIESPSWSYGAGTNDSHSGGLGMQTNWGYGIVGVAGNYSQYDQEWAAERGYAASGYSSNWLYGQWFEWEYGKGQACLRYA